MARGRRKSTVKKTAKVVSTEPQTVTSVNIGKIDPIVEPVPDDVKSEPVKEEDIPQCEPEIIEEVPQPEEPVKEFDPNKWLPDPVKPTEILKPKKEVKKVEPEPVKDTTVKNEVKDVAVVKDTEPVYPKNVSSVIEKLRRQPAYRHLPYATLIKIASSKLRSRYFFNNLRTSQVTPNFTIK